MSVWSNVAIELVKEIESHEADMVDCGEMSKEVDASDCDCGCTESADHFMPIDWHRMYLGG